MRTLTLMGFLKTYLKYLSGENTLSVSRLADKLDEGPRLAHPLILYSVVSGQAERLLPQLGRRRDLQDELNTLVAFAKDGDLENVLEANAAALSEGMQKVLQSYRARRDTPSRDAKLKQVAREKVLALEQSSGVTRYRLSKDLRINPGNLHAFLAFGDVRKLSLSKAYQLIDYLAQAV